MNITNKNRYKLSAKFNKILAGLNEEEIRFAGDQKEIDLDKIKSSLNNSQKELQQILFSALQFPENN